MSRAADYGLTSAAPAGARFRFGPAAALTEHTGPNIAFGLLILFLLVFYSNLAQLVPQLEALRPAMVVSGAAVAMLVLELAGKRQSFRLAWPQGYFLVAMLGVAAVSTLQAIYIRLGYDTTTDLAKIALVYFVIENTITSERRVRTILWTLVAGGMFPAVGTIYYYTQGIYIEGTRAAWIGIFKNPNELAYALVLGVPIAIALASTEKWPARVLLGGVTATYLLAIYLTFSRGGLLGLFAVLGILGWKQKSVALKVAMVAALGVSLVVASLFWARKGDFTNLRSDTTVNQRIATIRAGMAMFYDHPFLGVGPGCSLVAYPLYVPTDAHCGCQDQLVIHNAFIQVLSEMGLLGFLPFMGLLGVTIFQLWKMQQGPSPGYMKRYAGGLELALWGFVACGVSGGFSYTWFPYILIGVAVAAKRIHDSRAPEAECRA